MGYKEGADLDPGFKYPAQHFNRIKNHWRQSDPISALFDAQPGMIASDSDDEKLYHITDTSPGYDEILQENFSYDANPTFNDLYLNGGILYVNETAAPTKLDDGVVIKHAANFGLLLKNPNISHGVTGIIDDDAYLGFQALDNNNGGARFGGVTETSIAFQILGIETTNDTTRSVAGTAAIELLGVKKSGASWGNVDANANIVAVQARRGGANETVAIFDEDGDLDLDATANDNQWDDHDDLILAHDLSRVLAKRWDEIIKYDAQALHDAGLIHYTPRSHSRSGRDEVFIRMKQCAIFTLCAFSQVMDRLKKYDKALLSEAI